MSVIRTGFPYSHLILHFDLLVCNEIVEIEHGEHLFFPVVLFYVYVSQGSNVRHLRLVEGSP